MLGKLRSVQQSYRKITLQVRITSSWISNLCRSVIQGNLGFAIFSSLLVLSNIVALWNNRCGRRGLGLAPRRSMAALELVAGEQHVTYTCRPCIQLCRCLHVRCTYPACTRTVSDPGTHLMPVFYKKRSCSCGLPVSMQN
jgi:hypothetical protein